MKWPLNVITVLRLLPAKAGNNLRRWDGSMNAKLRNNPDKSNRKSGLESFMNHSKIVNFADKTDDYGRQLS